MVKKDDFEFDSAGQSIKYISLDEAKMRARRLAQEDADKYLRRLGWDEITWLEKSAEMSEDYYRVILQFRRP